MFGLSPALIWLIVGIILLAAEFFIPGLVIAFFGIGALFTALFTALNIAPFLSAQLGAFAVTSILSLLLLRRYFKKIFVGKSSTNPTEAFSLDIGKVVEVTKEIDPAKGCGQIKYQGTFWQATADEIIKPGESAVIKSRDNISIEVKKNN